MKKRHRQIEDRLADVLLDAFPGGSVSPDELWRAKGFWARHQADVYAWEGKMYDAGRKVINLVSWDNMSECVKYGVRTEKDEYGHFVVWAKKPLT